MLSICYAVSMLFCGQQSSLGECHHVTTHFCSSFFVCLLKDWGKGQGSQGDDARASAESGGKSGVPFIRRPVVFHSVCWNHALNVDQRWPRNPTELARSFDER
ncbi:hypothetical protein BDP55DRAFT_300358 [Colletotrichum godetiae]|uniref:Uncharacterized protein n=1 Tax=Colletotrichum godetiae TaxID=1209918 RepID=A0AAJ0EX44_9PEZI|nr:uncharacterized protein BDP55DRAFT_300358 [Colletotrichum godetiae]KAK1690609.1 hypothetical protein BDP55DRAFT_300358 [Colletotrichum godetiae]